MSVIPSPRVEFVAENGPPESPDRGDIDGVDPDLDEAQTGAVRDQSHAACRCLDPSRQVRKSLVLPLVLAGVDRDALRTEVHQQRQPSVVGQTGDGRSQLSGASRLVDGVEAHRAEQDAPIGGLRPVAEHVNRHDVRLVPLGVGERGVVVADMSRTAADGLQRFAGRCIRARDVDVDPIAERTWLILLLEPDRRVPPHRVDEVVVTHPLVPERGVPERHHRGPVERIERQLHVLDRRRNRGQVEVPRRRRHRTGHLHIRRGEP